MYNEINEIVGSNYDVKVRQSGAITNEQLLEVEVIRDNSQRVLYRRRCTPIIDVQKAKDPKHHTVPGIILTFEVKDFPDLSYFMRGSEEELAEEVLGVDELSMLVDEGIEYTVYVSATKDKKDPRIEGLVS